MKVAVMAETDAGEPRVAATPETVKKMIALGATVVLQRSAARLERPPDQIIDERLELCPGQLHHQMLRAGLVGGDDSLGGVQARVHRVEGAVLGGEYERGRGTAAVLSDDEVVGRETVTNPLAHEMLLGRVGQGQPRGGPCARKGKATRGLGHGPGDESPR